MKKAFSILFLAAVILYSCQPGQQMAHSFAKVKKNNNSPLIAYIGSTSTTYRQLAQVTDYAKLPLLSMNEEQFNLTTKIPTSIKTICLTNTFELNDRALDTIYQFVAKGGTLFIANVAGDERAAHLMGMTPSYKFNRDHNAKGYYFLKEIFPTAKNKRLPAVDDVHEGFSQENFKDEIDVWATASNNKEYPILFSHSLGQGKVIVHNSVNRFYKISRGVLFASLLGGLEGVPYPVSNVANVHLDDFPAPVYNIYKEPVKSNLNKNMSQFVTDIWWPDMLALAQRLELKYTAYPAFDYNYNVQPPFIFGEWEYNKFNRSGYEEEISTWLGRQLKHNGHELGLHGYNHVSLTKDEWLNPDHMVTALNSAEKKWQTINFGKLPTSYVPPSNIIDSVGMAKLAEAIPSIKFIQSTYLGQYDIGGNREFGPENWNNHFFAFPRISSGFEISDDLKLDINSLFLFTGIWTHFLHPDDVFQIPDGTNTKTAGRYFLRNSKTLPWRSMNGKKGLYNIFEDEIKAFKKKYPYTRFVTATQGSELTARWRYARYDHSLEDGIHMVYSDSYGEQEQEFLWFSYVDKANAAKFEKELTGNILEYTKLPIINGYLYQIKTHDPFISVGQLKVNSGESNAEVVARVANERELFNKFKFQFLPLIKRLEELVNTGNYKEAATELENHVKKGNELTSGQWNNYANLMLESNNKEAMWAFLDSIFKETKDVSLLHNVLSIGEKHGYPNLTTQKLWYNRMLKAEQGNVDFLREYIASFNDSNNHTNIKQAYKQLSNVSGSAEDQKAYIKFLLDNKDAELSIALQPIDACEETYKAMATELAWYYADALDYTNALDWAYCSDTIDKETRDFWFLKSTRFEELKETNPAEYYGILIRTDEDKAYAELMSKSYCAKELVPIADKIAILFGNRENYRGALAWTDCATTVPVKDLLTWNYEVRRYTKMKRVYQDYMDLYPEDNEVRYHMATLLMYTGDLNSAAKITNEIASGKNYIELRGKINKDVEYLPVSEQMYLVGKYPNLFSDNTKTELRSKERLLEGHDVFFKGNSMNDRLDPTVLNFKGGYNLRDKKNNIHALAGVRGFVYPINFIGDTLDNEERNVLGLEYIFKNDWNKEYDLTLSARIEGDNFNNTFFHAAASISFAKEKNFYSNKLSFNPVPTGPGYVRGIYMATVESYNELQLLPKLTQIINIEGNYFTDAAFMATGAARTSYNLLDANASWQLGPLAEASYGVASVDQRDGFPYWLADKRFIAGAGVHLIIGKQENKFYLDSSATYFYENQGEPNFERYLANLNANLGKYFTVSAGAEFYTIENFFSNAFNLGFTYHLKPFKYNF
ncbi:DUF2194 domain-containing protein [Croceivirga sp. JEA036]|uniref:DUF2194 domain-containing protein n=1 Tax=Croceivirga sp. JEA036 TaxID=2721162 RepID=UPI00143CB4B9|nr:DUF2194 domain-containing protein [Croceivirga sp. JEA036]NJB36534.1 DUF2194 domain-containing protein [Croceivirga sp. JEA036]